MVFGRERLAAARAEVGLELARRKQALESGLAELRRKIEAATENDRMALASWHLDGGNRPAATVPALEQQLAELERDVEAAGFAASRALEARVEFFRKHRKRLARDAEQATKEAQQRYRALVGELGYERRAIDAVFRRCPVIAIPGYSRPLIRVSDFQRFLEEHTYRGDRVRPSHQPLGLP